VLSRRDVIVVASVSRASTVSARPETTANARLEQGQRLRRDDFTRKLVDMLYDRNDLDFTAARSRARDVVSVSAYERGARSGRVLWRGSTRSRTSIHAAACCRGARRRRVTTVTTCRRASARERAIEGIRGRARQADRTSSTTTSYSRRRIEQRRCTPGDLGRDGFCHGVEDYSRWLDGRVKDQPPYTLIDYFEGLPVLRRRSRITVSQIGAFPRRPRRKGHSSTSGLAALGARQPAAQFEEWGAWAR
jgi:excinuclease ABC subunit B